MQLPVVPTPSVQHIAILNCEDNVPEVEKVYGPLFSSIFISVFEGAAKRLRLQSQVRYSAWDPKAGQFPDPDTVDAIVVTGSMAGAYDTYPWIAPLAEFIKLIYTQYPRVRIHGVCFGHQIICQTLVGPHGVVVEKDPNGFEFGLQTITMNPLLTEYFPGLQDFVPATSTQDGTTVAAPQLRLQLGHGDHVVLPQPPATLPPGWMCIGSSAHCAVQGLFEPSRVLTFQPHFECDGFIMSESFLHLFRPDAGFSLDVVNKAVADTKGEHDSLAAAEWVLQFLLGMLPTPETAVKVK